jgi:hypothetical protein
MPVDVSRVLRQALEELEDQRIRIGRQIAAVRQAMQAETLCRIHLTWGSISSANNHDRPVKYRIVGRLPVARAMHLGGSDVWRVIGKAAPCRRDGETRRCGVSGRSRSRSVSI